MLALLVVAAVPLMMWLGQSALLLATGRRVRLRLSSHELPATLRAANRVITNLALAAALLCYPLLRGESPATHYARLLPPNERLRDLAWGVAAAVRYLGPLYLVWLVTGQLTVRLKRGGKGLVRRLLVVPLTAALGATLEELFFRAMLLQGLLEALDRGPAVVLGTLVFASAHYVRSVKRYWTFPGHIALGLLLCVAYERTGALWLPIGLHGAGMLLIMGLRPVTRSEGPAWLVGASIFPYAGAVGVAALLALTLNVWLRFAGGV